MCASRREPRIGNDKRFAQPIWLVTASSGEYFRVGVASFDASATVSKLKSLGVAAIVREKNAVSFGDPDGIRVQIGG
jgi:hypothetical protein